MKFDWLPEPALNGRQVAEILNIDTRELLKREANGCAPKSIIRNGRREWPASVVRSYLSEMAHENGWQIGDIRLCRMETKLRIMCK